jgi:hypothetical protein
MNPAKMQENEILIAVTRPRINAMNPRITAALLISHLNHHDSPD